MSIIIFIAITILSYITICELDPFMVSVDQLNAASSILIGLCSVILYCVGRILLKMRKFESKYEDIMKHISDTSNKSKTNNIPDNSEDSKDQ